MNQFGWFARKARSSLSAVTNRAAPTRTGSQQREVANGRSAGRGCSSRYEAEASPENLRCSFCVRSTPGRHCCWAFWARFCFLAFGQLAHELTAEEAKRFLPSPSAVVKALIGLIVEKDFMSDVAISASRIFGSFFIACLIAVPLGVLMGCFAPVRALVNPVISGRALPACGILRPASSGLVRPD